MTAHMSIGAENPVSSAPWRVHLMVLGAASAAILLLFARDVVDMVRIWQEASTYNHCLLIAPIIAWLVYQRRDGLRRLVPGIWPLALVWSGLGSLAWLVGEAGGVALARHAGLVAVLQGAAMALLGPAVSRALAFPIFYAIFLVPFGDELVPMLQTVTARMSMALLAITGVPAHIEGIFITTPGGYFKVAEACAGVKFLVAMVALGALVANVGFRSWQRRAVFMLAAVAVPILANGLRAWGTIYLAQHADLGTAASFDHVFYGWIFFAIVIAILIGGAWRFFDRGPDDPWFDPLALQSERPASSSAQQLGFVAAATVMLAALPSLWSAGVAASSAPPPSQLLLPDVPGWQRVSAHREAHWRPHYDGADRMVFGHYSDAGGRDVDLAIVYFARQSEGREMVGFGQGSAGGEDSGWAWTEPGAPVTGGLAERLTHQGRVREAVTFYRVGNTFTGSASQVKLATMRARLLGGDQSASALIISAEGKGVDPRIAINAFLAALGPVDAALARASGR